uniref:uncharacterized protein LOC104265580 n=1 Tax=Ciona intestinalis TaxID=7719 RepID=UPI0005217F12|nr:uncharacterized protein LOC104265580 [Ciona intestinalis]|eukprot:XP_009858219.1 uncharacterized protein LOC104265580 [Ciona intestinalis]
MNKAVASILLLICFETSADFRSRIRRVAEHIPSSIRRCDRKLGLESGDIPDDRISVSTVINEHRYGKENARLNGDNAWVTYTAPEQWIQIDLGKTMYVSGVQTQGQIVPTHGRLLVSQYKVKYKSSPRGNVWQAVSDRGGPINFNGNTDGTRVASARFPEPVLAQIVRIVPVLWPARANRIALRLELLGCSIAADSGCGSLRSQTKPRGSISSMNYPGRYDNNANCRWQIIAPIYQVIILTFDPGFALEYGSNNCRLEYVEILDVIGNTEKSLGKFCGKNQPGTFSSTRNVMKVQFMTDHYEGDRGFRARYNFVNGSGCGGPQALTEPRGFFQSMNYPEPYSNNAHCIWDIYADVDKLIEIRFSDMQIARDIRYPGVRYRPGTSCIDDSLQIKDVENGLYIASMEHRYCDSVRPPNFISISNRVRIAFQTNEAIQAKGFFATYQVIAASGCGGPRDQITQRGLIQSKNYPEYYEPNLRCEWIIKTEPENDIQITFHDFALEEHANCTFDIVSIYDGKSDQHRLGAYCTTHNLSIGPLTAHSGVMKIVFKSDDYNQERGFNASYRVVTRTRPTSATTTAPTLPMSTTTLETTTTTITTKRTTPTLMSTTQVEPEYDITTTFVPTTKEKKIEKTEPQNPNVLPRPDHNDITKDGSSPTVTEEMGKLIIIGLASVAGLLISVILTGIILCCRQHFITTTMSAQGSFRNAQNSSNAQNLMYDYSIASTNQVEHASSHVSDSFSHQGTIRRVPSRESRIYFSIEECPNSGDAGRPSTSKETPVVKAQYKKYSSRHYHCNDDSSAVPFENEVEEEEYYDEDETYNVDSGQEDTLFRQRQRCGTIERVNDKQSAEDKMMVDNILYESADSINNKEL